MRTGILLSNLGTPDSPSVADVKQYLGQFLWDPRVIKMWRPAWWLILNLIILNTRPARSAAAYQKIWTDQGSPLLVESTKQAKLLKKKFTDMPVELGMRYGSPSIENALNRLYQEGVDHFLVLGLYPQFSYTTTSSIKDEVKRVIGSLDGACRFTMICDYHRNKKYLDALTYSIQHYQNKHGTAEKLLMSFHGIPKKYVLDGDPYAGQCEITASLLAQYLELDDNRWKMSFQSRLGPTEWLQPYTDETLEALGKSGIKSVQVVCPGFSTDCLETLEEVAMENRDKFLRAGGTKYEYIPCLNSSAPHIEMMKHLIEEKLT